MSSRERRNPPHLRREPRRAPIALGLALAALTVGEPIARADKPSLLAIRSALEHYRIDGANGGTLSVLSQLTRALAGNELDARGKLEARFLRAAVGTDILVLARGRRDPALEQALAGALGAQQPLPALLDAELASCATGVYRGTAQQMRGTLALLAAGDRPTRALLDGASGSQRDLLLARAAVDALAGKSDEAALAALTPLASDPCTASACPAPYDRFAPAARAGVAAFADAGAALERLRAVAAAGDPLALAAQPDFDTLSAALHERSLLPPARLSDAPGWTRADGSQLTSTPELLISVNMHGVRYGFASRVRLDEHGALIAYTRQEPAWPALAEIAFVRELRAWVEPVPELVAFVQRVQQDGPLTTVISAEPGTTTHVLAHMLASWKRAGGSGDLLLNASGASSGRAQLVQLWSESEPGHDAPLGMRVRLGGYSLKQGEAPTLDIPRVRTDAGWRFDTDTLDTRVRAQRYPAARVSFMADVAAEDFIAALLHVAGACDTVAVALP